MSNIWAVLRQRALEVSLAGDAFSFQISWLGILIVVALILLVRWLRR